MLHVLVSPMVGFHIKEMLDVVLIGVDGNVANFHHAAVAVLRRVIGSTGPVTAHGQIQDDEERAVCQRAPDTLIAQLCTTERVVDVSIHGPLNDLLRPVIAAPIDLDGPGVKPIPSRDTRRASLALGLVADTTGKHATMRRAVAGELAVDLLEDVEFTTLGPRGALVDAVAQHPEGRPDALLLGVVSESDGSFHLHYLAGGRRECGAGLDAAGCPLAVVFPGNELDGAATGELDVPVGGGVDLYLVVGVNVLCDVPTAGRRSTCWAIKGILPYDT